MVNSIAELVATATASFLLGWTYRKFHLSQVFKKFSISPGYNTKMVIVVRTDLPMSKGEI